MEATETSTATHARRVTSTSTELAHSLRELAALELAHSDRLVQRFGQRAYDVVRECRSTAALASSTSSKLSNGDGVRRTR